MIRTNLTDLQFNHLTGLARSRNGAEYKRNPKTGVIERLTLRRRPRRLWKRGR